MKFTIRITWFVIVSSMTLCTPASAHNGKSTCKVAANTAIVAAISYRQAVAVVRTSCGKRAAHCAASRQAASTALADLSSHHDEMLRACPDQDGGDGEGIPAVNPGDLVITEIMSDPLGVTDSAGEWFELYNPTSQTIDLNGLNVKDNSGSTFSIGVHVTVPPGGFVVLGANSDVATNGGVAVDIPYANFILSNAGDTIELTSSGTIIDRVSYDATFPLRAGSALSLNPLLPDAASNDSASSWCSSTESYGTSGDLGTPGTINSPCPP